MMKKQYETAEMTVIALSVEDVVVTSGGNSSIDPDENEMPIV